MDQAQDRIDHGTAYRRIFSERSDDEVRTLARIKRFLERVMGDDRFRDALKANVDDPRPVAASIGVDLDPRLMRPLWQHGYTHLRFAKADPAYPLSILWDRYIGQMLAHRDFLKSQACTHGVNPRFDAWRERQILRTSSECGLSGGSITHPLVAYELSDGCSVGCWFCGISADKFKGNFAYTEANVGLWCGVQETMVELFGDAAQSAFCYWATDPMDNPDYARFIDDVWRITGYLPQTTTAAPLRDPARTREIIAMFEDHGSITNRFSILTRTILERVHEEFTPDELMGVELVLQNKEALMIKAPAGKARERAETLKARGEDPKLSLLQGDHSTIACVSGFLVNMVKGTVQMITPTRPTPRWKNGYKILGTRFFDSVPSYRRAIESLLDAATVELHGELPVRLRPDLQVEDTENGFAMFTRSVRHECKASFHFDLKDLLLSGEHTYGSILESLVGRGEDVLVVDQVLEDLFLNGLLMEDVDLREAGAGSPGASVARFTSSQPAAS
ncbi:radical SAM family RiPP maturation amino acid epimerase [Candidatus Binatia bacterium]|jgi:radical SAM family RiPP maturation amino acid epimerase|nr:radical SAM family RiPP maturation amino acid epimerase [Candidatus Binatia bacterium]